MNFHSGLIQLKSELKASTTAGQLKQCVATCDRLFAQAFWEQEVHTDELLLERAVIIDTILMQLWPSHLQEKACLVAVGGFGRKTLHPHSDIDILILTKDEKTIQDPSWLSQFWDLGLQISHSIRTVKTCLQWATKDATILTNLIESRSIIGSQPLWKELIAKLATTQCFESFYHLKLKEIGDRYSKFSQSAYCLEPHIKEGVGSLRDIQTIRWLIKYAKLSQHPCDLLNSDEQNTLLLAEKKLNDIRYALHLVAGRAEERLLLEYQQQIAHKLYPSMQINHAIEGWMQSFYKTIYALRWVEDVFFHGLIDSLRQPKLVDSSGNLSRVTSIELSQPANFESFLDALHHLRPLQVFSPNSIRAVRSLTQTSQATPAVKEKLLHYLGLKAPIYYGLKLMKRYGVLGILIPAFQRVAGQMQFDLFHLYTVDEHTLRLIAKLDDFSNDHKKHYGPCQAILETMPDLLSIRLAALFHDIGKGAGDDHSKVGATLVESFCDDYLVSSSSRQLISWLVKNHLLLSMTAQKEDTSDPDIIEKFCKEIPTLQHLDYLFVLTVADILATNESLLNSWRQSLLSQLYHAARLKIITLSADLPFELSEHRKKEALSILKQKNLEANTALALWEDLRPAYFMRDSADSIAWQTEIILKSTEDPLIAFRQSIGKNGLQILVYCQDSPMLFAKMTHAFYRIGLNIVSANLTTTAKNKALDSYHVTIPELIVLDNSIFDEWKLTIRKALLNPLPSLKNSRKLKRKIKAFKRKSIVTIKAEPLKKRSKLSIDTLDRAGILAHVAGLFVKFHVSLLTGNITTIGERVEDVLYICSADNLPLSDKSAHRLATELLSWLDSE